MPTIGFSDLRKGAVMEIDGQPYEVLDYQKHKMQQRAPVTRIKMRNLFSGAVTEKTFQAYHTTFTTEYQISFWDRSPDFAWSYKCLLLSSGENRGSGRRCFQ